jgi:hypothetical protein
VAFCVSEKEKKKDWPRLEMLFRSVAVWDLHGSHLLDAQ